MVITINTPLGCFPMESIWAAWCITTIWWARFKLVEWQTETDLRANIQRGPEHSSFDTQGICNSFLYHLYRRYKHFLSVFGVDHHKVHPFPPSLLLAFLDRLSLFVYLIMFVLARERSWRNSKSWIYRRIPFWWPLLRPDMHMNSSNDVSDEASAYSGIKSAEVAEMIKWQKRRE